MAQHMTGFGYILALFVFGVMLKIYLESDSFNLRCIVSSIDGNKYCVRENKNIEYILASRDISICQLEKTNSQTARDAGTSPISLLANP